MNARSGPVAMAVYPDMASSATLPLLLNDLTTIFEAVAAVVACSRIESNMRTADAEKRDLNKYLSVCFAWTSGVEFGNAGVVNYLGGNKHISEDSGEKCYSYIRS